MQEGASVASHFTSFMEKSAEMLMPIAVKVSGCCGGRTDLDFLKKAIHDSDKAVKKLVAVRNLADTSSTITHSQHNLLVSSTAAAATAADHGHKLLAVYNS